MESLVEEHGGRQWRYAGRASRALLLLLLSSGVMNGAGPSSAETSVTVLERTFGLDEIAQNSSETAAAAEAYRAAAESGDLIAHLKLGYLYETGKGVARDSAAARRHYEAAAAGGLAEAHLRLAICHLEGWGGPVDRAAFAREIRIAAEAGYAPAQRILSDLYALGFAVPLDRAESLRWLERAALQDEPGAQVALGQRAEQARGLTLTADKKLARTWYQLSAEQEYTEGMRAMARTFLAGKKSDRDWATGHRWLELAAESGDAQAPYILAVCELLHVDSPDRNNDRARQWLKEASDRGNPSAKEVLNLEKSGESLAAAMTRVLSVPSEQRYVDQVNTRAKNEADKPTRRPVVIQVIKPTYPESLLLTATKGEALVQFTVDQTGKVQDPKVLKTTHPLFGERAVEAVLQWHFRPGVRDGQPVATRMQVPLVFDPKSADLSGIDGLILFARHQAKRLGPEAEQDAKDLSLAKPVAPPPYPVFPDHRPLPDEARALIMLVIDPQGRPLRGYVLDARPEELGPAVLAAGLAQRYHPRASENQAAATSSVLLGFQAKPSAENVFRTVSSDRP